MKRAAGSESRPAALGRIYLSAESRPDLVGGSCPCRRTSSFHVLLSGVDVNNYDRFTLARSTDYSAGGGLDQPVRRQ
ncbi:hypothetical protein [Kibdelosporangium philippinense]|uniref:hypothetical protein n=1 Tax=Kibdelosporangium philippinense TaxID=211113 RepID=UPI00361CF5EF